MKSHHKIQQYACNQCPRRFTQVTSLNQHLLLHTGFSGFYCPQCPDKTFKQQSQLHTHMKTHGLSFPYSCSLCEEKFLQMAHLSHHMKMHEEYKYRWVSFAVFFVLGETCEKYFFQHLDVQCVRVHLIRKHFWKSTFKDISTGGELQIFFFNVKLLRRKRIGWENVKVNS